MTGKLKMSVSVDGSPARTSTPKSLAISGAKIAIRKKKMTTARHDHRDLVGAEPADGDLER